jgi:predicted phage-related endonuclease
MIESHPITSREEWLTWRKQDVTASNLGALFGVHPYTTALRLYVEKRGVDFPDKDDNKVTRRGRWLEPAIGGAVAELRPDWTIKAPNVYLRDAALRLGATPDFYLYEGIDRHVFYTTEGIGLPHGVLQAKSVSPAVWHDEWLAGEELPRWIELQCRTEMLLTNATFGVVAVMLVDPFNMDVKLIGVPRDADIEHEIVDRVNSFWAQVEAGIEPTPDYGRDTAAIKALHPRETKGVTVDLSSNNYLPELLDERRGLKTNIDRATNRCTEIENELRYLLKDAEVGTGLDGWSITYKTQNVKGYTVEPRTQRPLIIKQRKQATA